MNEIEKEARRLLLCRVGARGVDGVCDELIEQMGEASGENCGTLTVAQFGVILQGCKAVKGDRAALELLSKLAGDDSASDDQCTVRVEMVDDKLHVVCGFEDDEEQIV